MQVPTLPCAVDYRWPAIVESTQVRFEQQRISFCISQHSLLEQRDAACTRASHHGQQCAEIVHVLFQIIVRHKRKVTLTLYSFNTHRKKQRSHSLALPKRHDVLQVPGSGIG